MWFRAVCHLGNRFLRFPSIKWLKNGWSLELIHKLAVLLINWYDIRYYVVQIKFWVNIAEERTSNKSYGLVQFARTELFAVWENLDQKNVNYWVNTKKYLLLGVFVSKTDLETVFAVVSRLELVVVVVLSCAWAEFTHKFEGNVWHVE